MLPASVMADELFDGDAARLLLLATRCTPMLPIDAPGSGAMGFLMLMLAQDTGFPYPSAAPGQLTAALVQRATSAGAQLQCDAAVDAIDVRGDHGWPCHRRRPHNWRAPRRGSRRFRAPSVSAAAAPGCTAERLFQDLAISSGTPRY